MNPPSGLQPAESRETSSRRATVVAATAIGIASAGFYLFAYNSGYGFDALEYLVIGRSLNDGYSMYSFVPSKSWGWYLLLSALFRCGLPQTHAGVSLVVTSLFTASLAATWCVVRRTFDTTAAAISTALVALCAAFMELNYLEPETICYLCGLAAFYLLAGRAGAVRQTGSGSFALAGAILGIGCAFKSIVACYLLGALLYIVVLGRGDKEPPGLFWRRALAFAGGCVTTLLAPYWYFAASGRGAEHVYWNFIYPLLYYPANTRYAIKLYTKLLWFPVFILLTIASYFMRPAHMRKSVRSDRKVLLILLLGLASLVSLLKTQSSHYVFPGAAFLSILMGRIFALHLSQLKSVSRTHLLAVAAGMTAVIAASAYLYRPNVYTRLFSVKDYGQEIALKRELQSRVPRGKHILGLGSPAFLYWISGRYPNIPVVNTAEQTTWWLRRNPSALERALDDPHLALVEWNPAAVLLDDPDALRFPQIREALDSAGRRIQREYVPTSVASDCGYALWARKLLPGSK